ncbi:hypothetical protein KC660_03560 [Candidatus Dojkabacteria bacterium]|uniref:SprT-like domain-containing protein n=1 Tax=Candidatus Dojkabacteria bacterium TaxID=2099670 RepID=A0A955L4E6_9BACT|nr:hypothetical protein [Candidatus Dojkabacteria bacterium]
MRDNLWLESRLDSIWSDYFADVEKANVVKIKFGKKARQQLGSIKWVDEKGHGLKIRVPLFKKVNRRIKPDKAISQITITSYFKDESVPDYVIDSTIAHELCHYAHGFSSPLQQRYDHPHKGNVVGKELRKRGLGEMEKDSKIWLKENWRNIVIS